MSRQRITAVKEFSTVGRRTTNLQVLENAKTFSKTGMVRHKIINGKSIKV